MEQKKNPIGQTLSRRQMLRLMGGAVGMTALAACAVPAAPGAAPATDGGAAAPAEAPRRLVVNHRREYFEEMETLFAAAVQKWADENNVEVETSTVAAEANQDFVPKLLAQVEAGDPPDLVYHVRLVQQLYAFNALEPVSDTVAEAIALYGDPSYGHFANNQIEGEWYGIPYINSGGGHFARRSVFEAIGLDPLTDLTTYDQIRDAVVEASGPDMYAWGRTVNRGGDGHGTVLDIIKNWGGHVTNEDMTELTFNSPETVAAVEWLTELYTSEQYAAAIPPGVMAWTDSSNNEAYLAGNLGYTSNAASVYAAMKANGSPYFEDTVVLNIPMGPYGEQFIGGGGNGQMQIPRGAKNVTDAKALAMNLLDPNVFLPISLVSAGLFLPAYAKYYEMSEVVAAFEADDNLARMGEQTQGTDVGFSWPAPPSPYFDAVQAQSVLNDMMAQTITQGVSPADAVAQAQDRMVQIAQEMGVSF